MSCASETVNKSIILFFYKLKAGKFKRGSYSFRALPSVVPDLGGVSILLPSCKREQVKN
jgi:hypothetical protein